MVLQGYESLSRLASLLNPSDFQNLISRTGDGKPTLYLNTYSEFTFRFVVDPRFSLKLKMISRKIKNRQILFKLSDIAGPDISRLNEIDFTRRYARPEIRSLFPSLLQFFQKHYPDQDNFLLNKGHFYDLLFKYSQYNSDTFSLQIKKKDAQFLRATMSTPAKRVTVGRKPRVFDDRFYDLFIIAMQPSASSFGLESISKNILEWMLEDDEPNEPLSHLKESQIRERVKKIYQECELRNAKLLIRK